MFQWNSPFILQEYVPLQSPIIKHSQLFMSRPIVFDVSVCGRSRCCFADGAERSIECSNVSITEEDRCRGGRREGCCKYTHRCRPMASEHEARGNVRCQSRKICRHAASGQKQKRVSVTAMEPCWEQVYPLCFASVNYAFFFCFSPDKSCFSPALV